MLALSIYVQNPKGQLEGSAKIPKKTKVASEPRLWNFRVSQIVDLMISVQQLHLKQTLRLNAEIFSANANDTSYGGSDGESNRIFPLSRSIAGTSDGSSS